MNKTLGQTYRRITDLTGRCPGCDVETEVFDDYKHDGLHWIQFRHSETCPVYQEARDSDSRTAAIQARKRPAGRNSPCPCGSGRKYKHCCGHHN
jgi:hypothetical protein